MTKQGPSEANKGPKEYLLVALWAPGKNFGGLDKSLLGPPEAVGPMKNSWVSPPVNGPVSHQLN